MSVDQNTYATYHVERNISVCPECMSGDRSLVRVIRPTAKDCAILAYCSCRFCGKRYRAYYSLDHIVAVNPEPIAMSLEDYMRHREKHGDTCCPFCSSTSVDMEDGLVRAASRRKTRLYFFSCSTRWNEVFSVRGYLDGY